MISTGQLRVAFFVNPLAGYGSFFNLKGSDGLKIEDPEKSISIRRSMEFLRLVDFSRYFFIVPSGYMGEREVSAFTSRYSVIYQAHWPSTRDDTLGFLRNVGDADILVFAGGDGTARDILSAGVRIPVIGVPAGVKMYSSVFAISPSHAAQSLNAISKPDIRTADAEVMDIDEELYRRGVLSARSYGYLKVPILNDIVMNSKAEYDMGGVEDIAEYIIDHMDDRYYVIGPGNTCKTIETEMGINTNPLAFDIIRNRKLIKEDAAEQDIYDACRKGCRLIISPIGGQNFLIGRGNKQISSRVLELLDAEDIIVVASPSKAETIRALYVDSDVNPWKNGYVRVLSGYGKYKIVPVIL
ncbi:conserved hypothetical protein [Thermoplasma acidophilum]|uniref:ATP-NAD kinase n=1 Tax=Thermoplasma acidophilum (strain ATCC 25905 / DSM 1728 / JCM 9062 / NBRC 15155 / AMRC-C165) TaxID=273075 RepID=Q9HJA2_THEAC|nr:ATP-NAD kinase family protein [Thermoplasma acidophilum]CAC12196.1 conserved hypothetical protein [Thermoplasma acidophilum]